MRRESHNQGPLSITQQAKPTGRMTRAALPTTESRTDDIPHQPWSGGAQISLLLGRFISQCIRRFLLPYLWLVSVPCFYEQSKYILEVGSRPLHQLAQELLRLPRLLSSLSDTMRNPCVKRILNHTACQVLFTAAQVSPYVPQ